MRSRGRWSLLVVELMLLASVAFAQNRDPAAADLLFRAGRAALDQGDYETACNKLQESHRLDPAAGTLINLAVCNERRFKVASAWGNWREALELMAEDDERRPRAEQHAAELELKLPRLSIELLPGSPDGTLVRRDRILLGAHSLGLPVPVDPGPHSIEVSAPQRQAREYRLSLREGQLETLVVEVGAPLAVPPEVKPKPGPVGNALDSPVEAERSHASPLRTVGFVVGGVGIAALGVGAVSGVLALQRAGTIRDTCDKNQAGYSCDEQGVAAADSGKTLATLSTVTTLAGAGALLSGAMMVLFAKRSPDQGLLFRPSQGGLDAVWVRKF